MAASPLGLQSPTDRAVRNPLSLVRVEAAVARSAAGIGLAFFAQSVPVLLGQLGDSQMSWTAVVVTAVVGSLVFAVVASVIGRLVNVAMVTLAGIYLLVVLTWPFAVMYPRFDNPWLYNLMTVATAAAAIGLGFSSATVYLVAVPAIYAVIRTTQEGGAIPPLLAIFNSVYSVILGGAVLILVTMLRAAAANVDIASTTALERYTQVVRQHATEAERVRVDAIVHDSVLTTLISAARAETPEAQRLSAAMAGAAMTHLREAALVTPDDGSTVRVALVADGIRAAIRELPADFRITETRLGPRAIPAIAGEAIHAAAVQAAVNSVNHAGADGVHRRLRFSDGGGVFEVEIADDGIGFELARVPRERLGVRTSIIERLANAGGKAQVVSAVGEGTTVRLRWPAEVETESAASEGRAVS